MRVPHGGAKHGLGGVRTAAQVMAAPGLNHRDGQWGACQGVTRELTGDRTKPWLVLFSVPCTGHQRRGAGSSSTQGPSLQWVLLGAAPSAHT